jgi:hypothetical protein
LIKVLTYRMDGGKLQRSSDGILRIKKSGSCLSVGLMIGTVISTLVAAFFTVRSLSMMFDPAAQVYIWDVIGIFGVTVFLGFATYFLYRTYTRPPVVIDPLNKNLTIGKGKKEWQISFGSVTGVSAHEPASVLMEGAAIWKFKLDLDTGESIDLGSISGDKRKILERVDQITQLLTETLGLKVNL